MKRKYGFLAVVYLMATSRARKKLRRILSSDPTICIIKTAAGNFRTHRNWFRELVNLPWCLQLDSRIATVADGWTVIIDEAGFQAFRSERPAVTPSIRTNSQVIEHWYIYATEGRVLSPLERQREGALQYGFFAQFEPVK